MRQKEQNFSLQRILIIVGSIISIMIQFGNGLLMGQSKSSAETQEQHRVADSADQFVRRFHETLDFGVVFHEMFVSDAGQRRRNAEIFLGGSLSPQLFKSTSDKAIAEAFVALMNVYFLKASYDLSEGSVDSRKETVTPPKKISSAMLSSRFFRSLAQVDDVSEDVTINTAQELQQFIKDANHISHLYRGFLSKNAFDSPKYKANVERFYTGANISPQVKQGYPDFGVDERVRIFVIEREIFRLFFIEEAGQLKVLTVGIGD